MIDKTQNPAEIYLVPVFDGDHDHVWCETPAPGEGMREEDATRYVREDIYLALQAQVEQLQKGKLYHVGLLNHIPSKVIDALNAELLYQNEKWGERHIRNQTVEGHLLVLRKELQEAEDGWMKNLTGRNSVESEITQVAAVAIQALINLHNAGRL